MWLRAGFCNSPPRYPLICRFREGITLIATPISHNNKTTDRWVTSIISLLLSVLRGNLGSLHSCGCYLTRTTYINIAAEQIHPSMAVVFPDGNFLFQPDNDTQHKLFRNDLKNMTHSSKRWLGLQIPQISIRSSICGMRWNKPDPRRPPPSQLPGLKGSAADVLMLWLIGVYLQWFYIVLHSVNLT